MPGLQQIDKRVSGATPPDAQASRSWNRNLHQLYNKAQKTGGSGVDRRSVIQCPYCERQLYGKLGHHLRSKQHEDQELTEEEIKHIIKIAKGDDEGQVTKENPINRNRSIL